MNHNGKSFLLRAFKEESGQTLPLMALLTGLFLGMGGLTLDLGRAFVAYHELQASTDAAALAGGYAMSLSNATTTSVTNAVDALSSVPANASQGIAGGANTSPNLPNASMATPLFKCLSAVTNMGVICSASPLGYNAIQVKQSVTIPTFFIRALGILGVSAAKSLTLTATSTASMRGAANAQYNVAVVIDTTASMGSADSDKNCGSYTTRISCALAGVQSLLSFLTPCTASSTSTNCTGFDQVSLFTYPNVQASTASNDTTCPTSDPTILPYSTPTPGATWSAPTGAAATYQITGYVDNYSTTNKVGGAINPSSVLGIATGAGVGTKTKPCSGLQTPGGEGTYFAGAIYAAASSLVAAQAANPSSQNALVILSDGDATATSGHMSGTLTTSGLYPSLKDQCKQAVTAAQYANGLPNTTVFSIAYGSASSGCSSDAYNKSSNPNGTNITPCQTMQQMASDASTFYSDAGTTQNNGQCVSAVNGNFSSLQQIFQNVADHLTYSRLIPDSWWSN
jgi:hypothetical protein